MDGTAVMVDYVLVRMDEMVATVSERVTVRIDEVIVRM